MGLRFHNADLERLAADGDYTPGRVEAIAAALERHSVLRMDPLPSGLFPASSAAELGVSGYGHVWVRDNVYVAHALAAGGRGDLAAGVARALLTFYGRHRHRLDLATGGVAPPAMERPHVRFDGQTLSEIRDEPWPHAQNDALGYCLWLSARLVRRGMLTLSREELETLVRLVRYLVAIRFWEDEDSGHWEETRKLSASSLGVVVAGLTDWLALLEERPGGGRDRAAAAGAATAARDQGLRSLHSILPGECAQLAATKNRRYDAALLFLVYPLEVVQGAMADLIVHDVRRYLQGRIGIRRYLGDSYFAPDYESSLPPADRTRDYSQDLSTRDRLLETVGEEAQWCLFDPILSAFYGRRYLATGDPADRTAQARYFTRALAHITPQWQCPELYYLRGGEFVAGPHTPLLWTQANLLLALTVLRSTVAAPNALGVRPF